jgi:hypothetical protein
MKGNIPAARFLGSNLRSTVGVARGGLRAGFRLTSIPQAWSFLFESGGKWRQNACPPQLALGPRLGRGDRREGTHLAQARRQFCKSLLRQVMARWSAFFVVLAILAGVFGTADAGSSEGGWGRTMFFLLLGLGVACLLVERAHRNR